MTLDEAIARGVAAGIRFRPPAPEASIAALERKLGLPLPTDLRAFYAQHDGAEGVGIVAFADLIPIAEALQEWSTLRTVWLEIEARPGMWSNTWLPITSDGGGSYLCVELTTGRVISYRNGDPRRPRVADSFTQWLANAEWMP